jgi:hypothetical protein
MAAKTIYTIEGKNEYTADYTQNFFFFRWGFTP